MVRGSQRAAHLNGSALVRLLAQYTEAAPPPRQAFADRLAQWLGWADAIHLAAALNDSPAPPPPAPGLLMNPLQAEQAIAGLRAALGRGIQDEFAARGPRPALVLPMPMPGEAPDPRAQFAPLRRRYVARQQAMETGIGALRAQLREALAARPGPSARLAAVDAVMEQVLAPQERALLATVPNWLERHFLRLCQTHADGDSGWLTTLCQDLQALLIAELDIRMQPAEGLLEALRASQDR